jgi:hypothetical protein
VFSGLQWGIASAKCASQPALSFPIMGDLITELNSFELVVMNGQ